MVDTLQYDMKRPKMTIKKLGKVFDLDTINLDSYQLIILADTSDLVLNNLDKFDSSLASRESDNTKYTRPTVALQLTEIPEGYQIEVSGANVTVQLSQATIEGLLLVKTDTMDILAAALNAETVTITSSASFVFETPIWIIGENVCPAS